VAYLTKASAEERWSILERVALASSHDTAPATAVRRPLELVDQTHEEFESAPPPTVVPVSEPTAAAARVIPVPVQMVGPAAAAGPAEAVGPGSSITASDPAPPTESMVPPTLPSSMPPAAPPQSSTQPRASVPDAAELLFEAMHDLTLLDSALDGARFSLEAALRAVPCLAALVHLRDPASLELVVVHTLGPRADGLLRMRTPQADPLVARASRAGRPVVVTYGGIPGAEDGPCTRHAFFDPWSAAVVPVSHGGQLLGLIEMIDPLDGAPFADAAQDALAYVAERLARFLVDHPAAPMPAA
jgi:hypothetical protein